MQTRFSRGCAKRTDGTLPKVKICRHVQLAKLGIPLVPPTVTKKERKTFRVQRHDKRHGPSQTRYINVTPSVVGAANHPAPQLQVHTNASPWMRNNRVG